MFWPQYAYLALSVLGLGYATTKHGEPHKPYSALDQLVALIVGWFLLWTGGFFNSTGTVWP